MKHQKLPFELELERLAADEKSPGRMIEIRDTAFLETVKTRGFQLVTALLRDLERRYFDALRSGTHPKVERLLGRIEGIEEIRRSLVALLPVEQRPNADWHDAETEEFVLLDTSAPRDETTGE